MQDGFGTDIEKLGNELGINSASVLTRLTEVQFPSRDLIYCAGDQFNGVYFVLRGITKSYSSIEGVVILTMLVLTGDVLRLGSLHSGTYLSDWYLPQRRDFGRL